MRTLTMLMTTAFLAGPLCAQSQAMGKKESSEGRSQEPVQDQSAPPSQIAVRGTAIAVDPETESITVTEYMTGANRTFAAAKGALKGIKTGDRVNVTPEHENPNRARKIEKEEKR
jgi:hypothetical protein